MHSDPKPQAGRPARGTLLRTGRLAALLASVAAIVAGCKTAPEPTPGRDAGLQPGTTSGARPATGGTASVRASDARTPREYRRDAAGHLYGLNADRIFKGRMPPMLYAVGVLQVEVDRRGHIISTHWMRAPRHAPEVMAEIERTVRRAAPYPAPERLGKVTYTDTWLWDQSGRFQLDTLTEGQD